MYEIVKINESTYELKLNCEYAFELSQSIKKIIKSSYFNEVTNKLYINAEKIIPFNKYLLDQNNQLSHLTCIKLIESLTKQIKILYKMGYGFYGFNIENIITIDNYFLFCDSDFILPIENDSIVFYYPINKPIFVSPEVNKLTKLPTKINYKCIYFSLGSFILFCLLNANLLVDTNEKELNIILQPIINTKIYWFIKRCLNNDINSRHCLLI
jgi:hypothetical protein